MKITRVGGRISRDRLPPGGQPVHGWLALWGATCPGGKINWDTGVQIDIQTFRVEFFRSLVDHCRILRSSFIGIYALPLSSSLC